MDVYDGVRTCCKGADVCKKCWIFIASAVKILEASLRYDFGFSNMVHLFVVVIYCLHLDIVMGIQREEGGALFGWR